MAGTLHIAGCCCPAGQPPPLHCEPRWIEEGQYQIDGLFEVQGGQWHWELWYIRHNEPQPYKRAESEGSMEGAGVLEDIGGAFRTQSFGWNRCAVWTRAGLQYDETYHGTRLARAGCTHVPRIAPGGLDACYWDFSFSIDLKLERFCNDPCRSPTPPQPICNCPPDPDCEPLGPCRNPKLEGVRFEDLIAVEENDETVYYTPTIEVAFSPATDCLCGACGTAGCADCNDLYDGPVCRCRVCGVSEHAWCAEHQAWEQYCECRNSEGMTDIAMRVRFRIRPRP